MNLLQHRSEDGDVDLCAGEMHAAALGERVAEVASWAADPVFRQMGLNGTCLSVDRILR